MLPTRRLLILLVLLVVQDFSTSADNGSTDNTPTASKIKTGIVQQILNSVREYRLLNQEEVIVDGRTYVKQNRGQPDEEVELADYLAFLGAYCAKENPADCYDLAAFTTLLGTKFTFVVAAKLVKLAHPEDIAMGVIPHEGCLEFVMVDKQCVVVTGVGSAASTETATCDGHVEAYTPKSEHAQAAPKAPVQATEVKKASSPVDHTKTGLVLQMLTKEEYDQWNTEDVQVNGKTYKMQSRSDVEFQAYLGLLTTYCDTDQPSDCYTLAVFTAFQGDQFGQFVTAAKLMNAVEETHLRKCVNENGAAGSLELKRADGQCVLVTGVGDDASIDIAECTVKD